MGTCRLPTGRVIHAAAATIRATSPPRTTRATTWSPTATVFAENPMVFPPLGLFYLWSCLERLGHRVALRDLSEDDLGRLPAAVAEVRRLRRDMVGSDDLLLGLFLLGRGPAYAALDGTGLGIARAGTLMRGSVTGRASTYIVVTAAGAAAILLYFAWRLA